MTFRSADLLPGGWLLEENCKASLLGNQIICILYHDTICIVVGKLAELERYRYISFAIIELRRRVISEEPSLHLCSKGMQASFICRHTCIVALTPLHIYR